MKRSTRFLRTLLFTCWLPAVLIPAAICYQALRITGAAMEYIAVGKLQIGNELKHDQDEAHTEEILRKQIEILNSADLQRKAKERLIALHPELKEIPVEIHCSASKTTALLSIAAIGSEAKYTRVFLDALIDEYILFSRNHDPSLNAHVMERPIHPSKSHPIYGCHCSGGPLIGGAAAVILMLVIATLVALLMPVSKYGTERLPPPLRPSEMKCDFCDREASVFLTQIIGAQKTMVSLCDRCSKEKRTQI